MRARLNPLLVLVFVATLIALAVLGAVLFRAELRAVPPPTPATFSAPATLHGLPA